jgi:hypothetical protein
LIFDYNKIGYIIQLYAERYGLFTILDLEPEANHKASRSGPLDKCINVNVKLPSNEGVNNLITILSLSPSATIG